MYFSWQALWNDLSVVVRRGERRAGVQTIIEGNLANLRLGGLAENVRTPTKQYQI